MLHEAFTHRILKINDMSIVIKIRNDELYFLCSQIIAFYAINQKILFVIKLVVYARPYSYSIDEI